MPNRPFYTSTRSRKASLATERVAAVASGLWSTAAAAAEAVTAVYVAANSSGGGHVAAGRPGR